MHARSWPPDWKSDIDSIADCGGDLVNFVGMQGYTSTNALHPQLTEKRSSSAWSNHIAYAKSRGLKACFGTDMPRPDIIPELIRRAVAAGVDRWVVYDARGWFLPQTMGMLVDLDARRRPTR